MHRDPDFGDIWSFVKVVTHPLVITREQQSNMTARGQCSDIDFGYVCNVTLTLELWPRFNLMTPLGHGQQLCEVLSRSNMEVGSYGTGMDFEYTCMCTVMKLTFEIWHLVGPWHSWAKDNNGIVQI